MAFHYSLFLSREGCSSSPADPLFMRQCDAAEKRKPLGIGWGKLQTKQKRALFFLILNISFRKGHPYPLNYKLARNGFSAVVACCFFFAGSKISLSPLLPVSILVDSLLPSRKRLVRPFCVAFFCDPPLQFAFFG